MGRSLILAEHASFSRTTPRTSGQGFAFPCAAGRAAGLMRPMSKAALRETVRTRLARLQPAEILVKSQRLREQIVNRPEWRHARTIALFAAQAREPQLDALLEDGAGEGKVFCFPKVTDRTLLFYRVEGHASLVMGRWNLREPVAAPEKEVLPERIELLLVPGVAFTPDGHRLGRGGGFYDRLLARGAVSATLLGVCFTEQVVSTMPIEPHDQQVHAVVSA